MERANETIQAKDAEIAEFHSRSKEIEREIADLEAKKAAAEADFEAMKAAMEAELEAKKAATEADCEAVLKNANAELAKLFLSASNRFDKYAGSLPEPKVSADKKPSAAKKKEPTVKRSKFQLVSPKSFFAGSYTGYVVLALETTGLTARRIASSKSAQSRSDAIVRPKHSLPTSIPACPSTPLRRQYTALQMQWSPVRPLSVMRSAGSSILSATYLILPHMMRP